MLLPLRGTQRTYVWVCCHNGNTGKMDSVPGDSHLPSRTRRVIIVAKGAYKGRWVGKGYFFSLQGLGGICVSKPLLSENVFLCKRRVD